MCLGVPGKILDVYQKEGLRMAKIDFGGVTRESCLEYVPEADVGDYVIVHVGFAINILSEEEAQESLKAIQEMLSLEEEMGITRDFDTAA
jgi:hydrogenase expression/formation protein HypC